MDEQINQTLIRKIKNRSAITIFMDSIILLLTLGMAAVVTLVGITYFHEYQSSYESSVANSDCNVQVIDLHGLLNTTHTVNSDGSESSADSTQILTKITDAENNTQIKGIVLSVDSGGGSPEAGSEIADYLSRANKPTVAWVRDYAASAAYWASLGTNRIIAGENSSVGSIGVTYSYLDTTLKDKKDGLVFQQISIGKYKDSGNLNKPLTVADKKMFLDQAEKIYENFVGAVAHYRNLDEVKVKTLADGSVMFGNDALKAGLIDEVGGINEVMQYLESKTGNNVNFCWHQ